MKFKLVQLFNLLIPGLMLLSIQSAKAQPVDIPDSKLRATVASALGVPEDSAISATQMASLTILWASSDGISDLTGLEHAVNLEELYLSSNSISDLGPMAYLDKLTFLDLTSNEISNPTGLEGLSGLQTLVLEDNKIRDLSSLVGLTGLENLYLSRNEITDLTPLAALTLLKQLYIESNAISELLPFAGLTDLQVLSLERNEIINLSPLAGLTSLKHLLLQYNLIEDVSPLAGLIHLTHLYLNYNYLDVRDGSDDRLVIQSLWDAGALVFWNSQYNSKILVDKDPILLAGLPGDTVTLSIFVENRGLGPLDYTITTSADWVVPSLTEGSLRPSGAIYLPVELALIPEYSDSLTGMITFSSNDPLTPVVEVPFIVHPPIIIPDPGLKAALLSYLSLTDDASISVEQMATITTLSNHRNIRSLAGLEYAVNLTSLRLFGNEFADLSPLAGLTNLQALTLYENYINDLSPLAELPNLNLLDVRDNYLDIQPGSQDREIIDALSQRATVYFEPQRSDRIPFEDWANQVGLPEGMDTPFDSGGQLGLPNLLTYAMGLDPFTADTSQLPAANVDLSGYLYTFTYYRNTKALGVDLKILTSTDLIHFTPTEPNGIEFLWFDENGLQQIKAFINSPENRLFFRLEVTQF